MGYKQHRYLPQMLGEQRGSTFQGFATLPQSLYLPITKELDEQEIN